jgi:hypothetical protein
MRRMQGLRCPWPATAAVFVVALLAAARPLAAQDGFINTVQIYRAIAYPAAGILAADWKKPALVPLQIAIGSALALPYGMMAYESAHRNEEPIQNVWRPAAVAIDGVLVAGLTVALIARGHTLNWDWKTVAVVTAIYGILGMYLAADLLPYSFE